MATSGIKHIRSYLFIFLLLIIGINTPINAKNIQDPLLASNTIQNSIKKGMSTDQVKKAIGSPEDNMPDGAGGEFWFYLNLNLAIKFDKNKKVIDIVNITVDQSPEVSVDTLGIEKDGYQKYIENLSVSYSDKLGKFPAKVKYSLDATGYMESNRNRTQINPAPMKVSGTIELTTKNKVETLKIINIVFTNSENIFGGLLISQTPGTLCSAMSAFTKFSNASKGSLGDLQTKIDTNQPILLLRINSDFTLSHYPGD